jgi:coenzyme F420-reducing hydrogenase delta subunit/Pyruvate/2-oxoacid:ferredoxin oxidoreductase delta subunit
MNAGLAPSDDIVMIQCAGSRGQSVPYCSRICCMVAIKNAILLKEMNPGARISILHNDIQVYGEEYEPQYRSAREKGIFFIKFSPERPPVVGDTSCKVYDSMIREELDIPADMVVLATPLVPAPDTEQLSRILKVPLGQDKFFFEAHVKLRPVDFANAGIYVCGTARGPAGIQESVEQALATASRAGIPLWNRVYITDAIGSIIDPELCTGCGVCESLCPYGAIRVEDKKAHTIKALCKGCGTCGAACPTHAITLSHFTDEQIQAQIHAALQERQKGEVKVIAFCCNWCSYAGADFAGVARFQYPPNTRIIRVMCSARIDPVFVFDALTSGADGVLISGCHLQDCHYIDGNVETLRRYDILHSVFEPYGLDGRIRLEWVSASEGERFSQITKSFVDQVKSLGKIGEDDLRNLEHLKGVFQGKKLRLLLGLARKSIRKGVPEEQYRERILHTIHQEMEAALKRDEEAKTLAAATRTITADLSSPVLARGGTLMVTGAVTGPPPKEIAVWVFGEGLRLYDHIPVDTRNRFSFVLHPADTGQMKTGEYSVIFQHPGENDRFDVVREVAGEDIVVKTVQDDAQVRPEGTMTAGSAAAVLTDMITSGDLDDLVTDVQFYVQEPFIRINPVPDKDIDESFTISGFTNIAEGEVLSVVISPIQSEKKRFYPVDDCVLTAHVRSGDDGENPWSADIPCSLGQPQEYRILVSSGKGAITTGKLSVKWR